MKENVKFSPLTLSWRCFNFLFPPLM